MKKQIGLFLGVLLLIGATGCGKEPQKQDMTGAYNVYEGYLTVKDNQLMVHMEFTMMTYLFQPEKRWLTAFLKHI